MFFTNLNTYQRCVTCYNDYTKKISEHCRNRMVLMVAKWCTFWDSSFHFCLTEALQSMVVSTAMHVHCLLWNDGVVSFCLFNFLRQKIDNSLLKTKNKNVGRRIAVIHPSIGLYATFLFLFFDVICDILLKNPQQHGMYFLNWQYLLLQWSLHYLIQRVIKWWKGSPLWN